jgi:hypothetical protein
MTIRKYLRKILGLAAVGALTITAFVSASASAATWTVEGAKLSEGTSNGVSFNAGLKTGTVAALAGTLLGQEVLLTAHHVTCTNCTFFIVGLAADWEGVLDFSNFTVDKPAGCKVKEPISTKALKGELVDHSGSERMYEKVLPAEGEVFATITVEGCAVAGSYNVKGVVYGEGEKWGTSLAAQPLKFTPAINTTLGGSLTLGTSVATLSAEGVNTLTSGKKFSADT